MVENKGFTSTTIIGIIPQYPRHTQNNIYGKVRMPPVGIISVLCNIQAPNLNCYAIDENNYAGPRDFKGMPDHNFLQKRNPAKIALFYGGMSNSVPRLFSLAQQYQKQGLITIAGGSHVDALPEETLHSGIDIVVHGEGEEIMQELMAIILNNNQLVKDYKQKLATVKGISFINSENKYIFTGRRSPIKNLNKLIVPDLTLIKHLHKKWSSIPINRGRGCNFKCEFCVVNDQYGNFKAITPQKAFEQVVKYSDMGYKQFFFTDDNFAQDISGAIELCTLIGNYKRKFKKKLEFTVQVRNEVAENERLIKAMKYAGVITLAIGFESPINQELKAMSKGVTDELLTRRARTLSKHFYLHGMFIFGYPGFVDSKFKSELNLRQRAKAYHKFFRQSKIDTIQVLNAIPLPGTRLRAKLESEKRIFPLETVNWDKYDGLFLCYDPTSEGLDAYELQTIPKLLMKKRYLGLFLVRNINYGNWITWAYNATIGFPLQFGYFYSKRFIANLIEKKRARDIELSDLPTKTLFYVPLVSTMNDIKRKWRNLAIKTYAGGLYRRWQKEYNESKHTLKLKKSIAKKTI